MQFEKVIVGQLVKLRAGCLPALRRVANRSLGGCEGFSETTTDARQVARHAKKTSQFFFAVFAPLRENCFFSQLLTVAAQIGVAVSSIGAPAGRPLGRERFPEGPRHLRHSLLAALGLALAAHAQDSRTVTEPVIPPSCAVLTAKLAAIDGGRTLADADEGKLDTARIQEAMDTCAKGHAVVLKADGARNAFLTGPLDLRPA